MSLVSKYKFKFLFLICTIFIFIFFIFFIIRTSFSSYLEEIDTDLEVTYAAYVFEEGSTDFNIKTDGIIPSEKPYVYPFSISNYNESRKSDVDLKYTIKLTTTTNLPLRIELYKNKNYDNAGVNILSNGEYITDSDGSWYKKYTVDYENVLNYNNLLEFFQIPIFSASLIS